MTPRDNDEAPRATELGDLGDLAARLEVGIGIGPGSGLGLGLGLGLRLGSGLGLGLDGRSRAERERDTPVQSAACLGEQDAGCDRRREAGEDGAAG